MGNAAGAPLQTAERALRLVRLLGQRGTVTLTEVAHELDVSPSMAHRLLRTCCELGFARQPVPTGPYEIGPVLHELSLGATSATALRDAGAAQLTKACKELRETLSVTVLEGRRVRVVETLEGDRTVRVITPIGKTFPAHATAGGRAMLAHLPEGELRRRFPATTLPPVSWATVTTWDELLAELARVRRRGWALQLGEGEADIAVVGYPILDGLGMPRAALAVSIPRTRLTTLRQARAVVEVLEPHAHAIQRRLRGSP